MPKHCFNILTFDHPMDELTFYFTNKPQEDLTRLYHSLVPLEVIEKYGLQDHYYTSFEKEISGFFPTTKKTSPLFEKKINESGEEQNVFVTNWAYTSSILKRHYTSQIHTYFKNKGYTVHSNFVMDTEVWLPSEIQDTAGIYKTFDRISLKIQFKTVSSSLELLVTFQGKSKIFKTPISKLFEEIPMNSFKRVIYEKGIFKLDRLPDAGKREFEKVYPIWNFAIRDALNQETEAPDRSNKFKKFKIIIDKFYENHVKNQDFNTLIPITSNGFIQIEPIKIGKVPKTSNKLLFGKQQSHKIPMNGIRDFGPFALSPSTNIHFFYILHEDEKPVATIIHNYFNGKGDGFSGLLNFVKIPYHPDKSQAIYFQNRDDPFPEIYEAITRRDFDSNIRYFAIYISPISKSVPDKARRLVYYKIKELLLKRKISSQVLDPDKIITNKKYHYSLPNIGIAILAKLNGIPWKLDINQKNELIVGVGAFKPTEGGVQYIGSAFSFSNTGKFNRFECFQKYQTRELAGSIILAVKEYAEINSEIDRLIIHFYKSMNKKEIEPIETGLKNLRLNIPIFIVAINKTQSSDIVAFDLSWEELMPVSGTYMKVGYNCFLLNNNTRYPETPFNRNDGFSFPIKLSITCSIPKLVEDPKTVNALIDQVYQFSRMYWKSVRQQNLPVTIKYPAIVAEMLPYFEGNEIPDYGKDNLWFL